MFNHSQVPNCKRSNSWGFCGISKSILENVINSVIFTSKLIKEKHDTYKRSATSGFYLAVQ